VAEYIKAQGGHEQASIIRGGFKTTAFNAAYVNGCAAHSIEIDDGHVTAHNHPGATVIPASLALAEKESAAGKELITAIVVGYEMGIRLAIAINANKNGALYRRSFYPSGVTGSFASAAVGASLLKLDGVTTANALGIAGLGPAATMGTFLRGAYAKHSFCGWPAAVGILAAGLAQAGYTGDDTIFEGPMGFCQAISDDFSLESIHDNFGIKWHILDIYRKRHAMCSQGHPIMDGILAVMQKENISANDISSVNIASYEFVYNMNSVRPVSSQQARFSVPYCAAKVIYEGRPITVEDCSPESLVNEEVLKIAEKVHMSLDHELDKYHRENQEERLSKMELILKDGRNIKKQTSSAKGWPDNPMTPSEVEEKFRILTSSVLKEEDCNRIVDLVQELDTVDDINTIMGSFIQR